MLWQLEFRGCRTFADIRSSSRPFGCESPEHEIVKLWLPASPLTTHCDWRQRSSRTRSIPSLAQMSEMMQQMDSIMRHSQLMARDMLARMSRMPTGQTSMSARAMQQMSSHMSATADNMKCMLVQTQAMMKEGHSMSGSMHSDMAEMHRQMVAMTTDMNRMMKVLEQMQMHRESTPSKP